MWEWNFSSNKYQQSFINRTYRSDTVTVNYTQPLHQQLLHMIINNQNMSRKEPSQLWVLVNEAIKMITNNETTKKMMRKWHITWINKTMWIISNKNHPRNMETWQRPHNVHRGGWRFLQEVCWERICSPYQGGPGGKIQSHHRFGWKALCWNHRWELPGNYLVW